MNLSHYYALLFGYGSALLVWWAVARPLLDRWQAEPITFEHPAREFGYALLGGVAILGVGQLYVHNLLLPDGGGRWYLLTESLNQLFIYSPMLLLLWIRGHGPETAWLPLTRVGLRVSLGMGLALASIAVFLLVRADSLPYFTVLGKAFHPQSIPHLVQVLLEDLTIAVLFVRLRSWIGTRWSIGLVAALFAAGHIPSMLSAGAGWADLSSLLLDTALGVGILSVLQRARDIWWFWWLHFAMDMMQFYATP